MHYGVSPASAPPADDRESVRMGCCGLQSDCNVFLRYSQFCIEQSDSIQEKVMK